jgi:anti-sigma factor RsiW
MESQSLHDLTPAYALDALSPEEVEAYEAHLAHCEQCREELAHFQGAAEALAYAAGPEPAPAAELRERILVAARAERANVVPLRPRWARPVAAVAAVAACLAVGLLAWNVSLRNQLGDARSALRGIPVSGANGSVVVGYSGSGALVLSDLRSAPAGKTYEAWVIAGGKATRAGVFAGGAGTVVIKLEHAVPAGAIVAVTVEEAGGVSQPTQKPIITSQPI